MCNYGTYTLRYVWYTLRYVWFKAKHTCIVYGAWAPSCTSNFTYIYRVALFDTQGVVYTHPLSYEPYIIFTSRKFCLTSRGEKNVRKYRHVISFFVYMPYKNTT